MSDKLREELAALAHEQWSGWMKYLFSKCGPGISPGTAVIPKWGVDRWLRQMDTPYSSLSDSEKESERKEADRVLEIIQKSNLI